MTVLIVLFYQGVFVAYWLELYFSGPSLLASTYVNTVIVA